MELTVDDKVYEDFVRELGEFKVKVRQTYGPVNKHKLKHVDEDVQRLLLKVDPSNWSNIDVCEIVEWGGYYASLFYTKEILLIHLKDMLHFETNVHFYLRSLVGYSERLQDDGIYEDFNDLIFRFVTVNAERVEVSKTLYEYRCSIFYSLDFSYGIIQACYDNGYGYDEFANSILNKWSRALISPKNSLCYLDLILSARLAQDYVNYGCIAYDHSILQRETLMRLICDKTNLHRHWAFCKEEAMRVLPADYVEMLTKSLELE